jgi:hypothetical protein
VPAKLLGLTLVAATLLLHREIKKARRRGYIGPRYRRIHRDNDRWKFNLSVAGQALGALICFIGALLCFTHMVHHG